MAKEKDTENQGFALSGKNLRHIIIGACLVLAGFLLMIGGGTDDPTQFSDKLFSFRRITLSPIIVVTGFVWVLVGIIRKFDK